MLISGDGRISVVPAAPPRAVAGIETVMIGHAPGRVDWRALLALPATLARLRDLGYERQVEALERLARDGGIERRPGDAALKRLLGLPLALTDAASFSLLFPGASTTKPGRIAPVAGDRAFLPFAVEDFFSRAGTAGATLWVIVTAENEAGLPRRDADRHTLDPWTGLGPFEAALAIPDAGLVGFPDLERLMLPADLAPLPGFESAARAPAFRPCGAALAPVTEPAREAAPEPPALAVPFARALEAIATGLAARPDMHALLTLPLADERGGQLPVADPQALSAAAGLTDPAARGLSQIQLVFPFLRTPGRPLSSPAGLLAGAMVSESAARGPWRSVAGTDLSRRHRPYPPQEPRARDLYRETHGIGVLVSRRGAVQLDDERLVRPAFGGTRAFRSGEVNRFVGWLRRELRRYGEALVFAVDPDDPRPSIVLDTFLRRLFAEGALAGRTPQDAYRLRQRSGGPGQLVFEIELDPALPIDTIRVVLADGRVDLAPGGRR